MAANSGILYITYVEKQGSFLRIWGQLDRNLPVIIEKSLTQMTPQFESGLFMPTIDGIQCGLLCCAKYKDGAYYRARITNIALLHQNVVEVHFVDYGNKDIIPIVNLRTIGNFAPGLITIPPQARDFILANVTHQGSSWDNDTIALVSSEIRYMELTWVLVSQINAHTLIKLFKNGEDVALSFFNRGMVLSIATAAQHMILQNIGNTSPSMYQVGSQVSSPTSAPPTAQVVSPAPLPQQVMAAPPTALLTYKAVSLEPGSDNNVYVSYVSDGPCHFSVQLKKLEDTLARLMKELNRMNLQPLEEDPIPGTVCVARCIEDLHICRAVVTSMVDGQYKVFYVDFGNTEVVSLESLYQIPFKYVIPKVMAMRYALTGLDRSSVTLEMKCAFKEFVSDKLLRMRALPPPTRSALPLCSLWDDKNTNVLDVLRQAALLAYPEVMQLTRGFSQEVRVSYVHSCSHFYVQIKSKEEELRKVMAELQSKCPYTNPVSPSAVKVGLPCCALFDADEQWYRAQILSKEGETVKVRYVDYGNEEQVTVNNLRMPPAEQLTALRPQALECCLNGYQNMTDDLERDTILEELILEKEFVMKVVEMQSNRALVDLIDGSRYNVGSLLLERLANAKSQVSPLLIQDSHQIEHRKRNNIQQRLDHRSTRKEQTDKGWGNEDKERKVWNNEDKERKGWNNEGRERKGWNNEDKERKGWNNEDKEGSNSRQDSWRQARPPRKDYGDERNGGDDFDRSKGRRDGVKKDNWVGNKDGFKKDSWGGGGDKEDGFKKDNWGGGGGDNFKKDSWSGGGGEPQWKRNGKSNQREGSEKSFSDGGSEKNWRRSPRTNNYNEDRRPKRKFESGSKNDASWNSTNSDSGFNSNNNFASVADPAPSSAVFVFPELDGRSEKVLISWFHDPAHFFCQLQEFQTEFRTMMNNIQSQYCNIKPATASVGAPVIALYPDDGVMYRALVLEIKGLQYRVQYIDFGNVATTDKVWPIENKLMKLAAQAICCRLNGVVPLNEKWGNSDAFSSYFDKESFVCSFILSEDQNYMVELTCDNQSVSEGLVSAGLARYDESLIGIGLQENFDPSLLLGQQMRIVLGEVQSLDTFYVQLQNGIPLLCTIHNLALATETYEDTLKQCIGSILIMYVDNVLEDKTEITLYDTSGAKLKIIEPDEGAFDSVEMVCPLPILNSSINGWISYLKPGDGEKFHVFIQPPEYANTLAQLLEDLFNNYDASEETALQPEVGVLYAVHSSDGNWYRGQAVSVDDQTVTVTFVDYGNSESVPAISLRELAPELMQQHLMALELLVSGIDETFIEHEVTASVWYGENGWEAEIQKFDETVPQTEPVAEELPNEEQSIQAIEETVIPEEIPQPQTNQSDQIGVPVILSHIDSPSEFYVQLSEDVDNINSLQETLQEQVSGFPDLENPAAGVLCAAPYSVDQQWYRAQVLDADDDITTVRFVDYGNTDVLTNVANHVKTLPSDLLSLEQHARRCSLIVKAADVEWSLAASERFEALTASENLSAEIVHQDEKTTYIQLFANAQNVAETLLQEGLAVKLQLETESSCSGYVSHLNSPSEFWVQLENSVADLEWIAEQLSTAENFPELEDLTPGSLCAALFPDDEMWYRARILSNTVAGLEVLFIDYGNSCTCSGLRQLPEDLIMLPALAQKCSLQKPLGLLQWSSQATEEFRTISADGATIFNIDRLSTGETSIVKLLLDGMDIATKLLAKTEDAFISHFESISSFWLQKVEDESKRNIITEKLAEASEWPKYEQKEDCDIVAALYPEDEQWYRARILKENSSEYEVLFIDFGNSSAVSDIRMLMCDIEKESPLAIKCKLEPLPGYRWNEDSSKKFAEFSDNGATIFQVEFVTRDTVRLYLNGNDIRSDLESTYISSAQNTPKKSLVMKIDPVVPQGIENFIDPESDLVVLSDTNAENNLIIDQTYKMEDNEEDQAGADVNIIHEKIETTLVSEEATKYEEIVENLEDKLSTEDIKKSEESQGFEDVSNTAELAIKDPPAEEITKPDQCEGYEDANKAESANKEPPVEEEITKSEECEEGYEDSNKSAESAITDQLVKEIAKSEECERFEEAIKSAESPIKDQPVQEMTKSEEYEDSNKTSESTVKDQPVETKSEECERFEEAVKTAESPIKDQPVQEMTKSEEYEDSNKTAESTVKDQPVEAKSEECERFEEVIKTAESPVQEITKSEEYENSNKTAESAINEPVEEIAELEECERFEEAVKTAESPIKDQPVQEITKSEEYENSNKTAESAINEPVEEIAKLEECERFEEAVKTAESPIKDQPVQEITTLEEYENTIKPPELSIKAPLVKKIATSGECEGFEDANQTAESVIKGSPIKEISTVKDKKDMQLPSNEITELKEHEALKDIKKTVELAVKEPTLQPNTTAETSEFSNKKLEKSEDPKERKKLTASTDEVNEQSSHDTHQNSSMEEVYIPQRRASIPYADKIVPGAISRGDLTKVLTDDNEQIVDLEKTIPVLNETDESKIGQCEQVVKASSVESKSAEQMKDTPNTSFCKVINDERIVPGAISRGETPEPPQTEGEKIVLSAVNGVEVKDNVLS